VPIAQEGDGGCDLADAAVGQHEDAALQHAQHAEGQDQRRHAQAVDQFAVDQSNQCRERNAADDDQRTHAGKGVEHHAGDNRDQPNQLADREVDHATRDDEGLDKRKDSEDCRLLEDVGKVWQRAELWDRGHADQHKGNQRPVNPGELLVRESGSGWRPHLHPTPKVTK
jgi:hypothetical protein